VHLPEATQYTLAVKLNDSTAVIYQTYDASSICSGSTCSVDPGVALANGDYRTWVLPRNSAGKGIWAAEYFTVSQ
jgi:hypothetical protein